MNGRTKVHGADAVMETSVRLYPSAKLSSHTNQMQTAVRQYDLRRRRSRLEIQEESRISLENNVNIQHRVAQYQVAVVANQHAYPHPFNSYFPAFQLGVDYVYPNLVIQNGTVHGSLTLNIPSIQIKSVMPSNHQVMAGQPQPYAAWFMLINSTKPWWRIGRLAVPVVHMSQQDITDALHENCTKVSRDHDSTPYLQPVSLIVTNMNAAHVQHSVRGVGFGAGAARDGMRNRAGLSCQYSQVLVFQPVANNGRVPFNWTLTNSYPMNAPNHDALYQTRHAAVNNLVVDNMIPLVSRNAQYIDHYDN